jgi:replicative DNA helicase
VSADARRLAVPLHSVEAEQAVLGALLMDPTAWPLIAKRITPADFFRRDHQRIFAAIEQLRCEGSAADAVTVSDHLERKKLADQTGGLAYLVGLVRDTPSAANVEAYADVVRDRAALRALRDIGQAIVHSVDGSSGKSAPELLAEATAQIDSLQAHSRIGRGLTDSRTLTGELIDDLELRRQQPMGLRTGLADFDELSCGLEPGDLIVIAARPGMGKTALLVSLASHVSDSTGVAVFSAEMPSQQLMRRCVALLSGVSQGRLRRAHQLSSDDWAAIGPAASTIGRKRLWIDDTAAPALSHLRAETFALKSRSILGLVLVDYVQLVRGTGANRYEQLRDVAYGLKALAKELATPIVLLAQLNRGVEGRDNKRPQISDLRDSGAIEEAADIIGLLYSESYYNPQFSMSYVLECHVAKNRNGQRGECLWHFIGEQSRIEVLSDGARAQYRQLRAKLERRGASDDL